MSTQLLGFTSLLTGGVGKWCMDGCQYGACMDANIALKVFAQFQVFVFAHYAANFSISVRFCLVIPGPAAPYSTCHNEDGIWANSPLPRTMEGRGGGGDTNIITLTYI